MSTKQYATQIWPFREDFGKDMPGTLEKIAEMGYSREDMDAWGARSHQLAYKARQEGFFDDEILPVDVLQADGTVKTIDEDQAARSDATVEDMAKLRPVFKKNGTIHPGNASPLNAGACALVLMDRETAKAKGVKPLARIVSMGFAGVAPNIMGTGPVPSSQRALEAAGLKASDIDYWEINEAFAIVTLNCMKEFNIPIEKVNAYGGAIAIGHPLGASGIRLPCTLARTLKVRKAKYGLANLCCGGGQGVAVVLENPEA